MECKVQSNEPLLTAIAAAMHLLVDGLCVCCLFLMASTFPDRPLLAMFVVYNVLAFLSQPITGLWADRMVRCHWMLLAAVLLLITGVMMASVVIATGGVTTGMYTVPVLLGLGNSLFHVWGGKQVAVNTGNDMRALGVFVSTGAMGLAIGFVCFSWAMLYGFLLSISLLAVVYLHFSNRQEKECRREVLSPLHPLLITCAALAGLMLFVGGRSYVAERFTAGMTRSSTVILLIGAISMAGKMAGGWIARQLGVIRALAIILTATLVCMSLSPAMMPAACIGLLLVNTTMPITLYLANDVLKGQEGLAFGLLAAALIPGYLLAVL